MNMKLEPIKRSTMTVTEAATYLGVSKDIVYKMCREKQIPHFRIGEAQGSGGRILFKMDRLERWVNHLIDSDQDLTYEL